MEIRRLEKTLMYDGIAFFRYRLEYPAAEEGAFPDFAKAMTESYRDYLEGDYFLGLCQAYDADMTRRKRFRHQIVQVTQRVSVREEGELLSLCFCVEEDNNSCQFGWTFDRKRGIVMTLGDFGLKRKDMKTMKCFYRNAPRYTVFDRMGKVIKKFEINP